MLGGDESKQTIDQQKVSYVVHKKLVDGLHAPLLMHLAEEDEFISKAEQAEIKAAPAKKPNATVYSYPSQNHAFSRQKGRHYNAAAATFANGRTREFLQ